MILIKPNVSIQSMIRAGAVDGQYDNPRNRKVSITVCYDQLMTSGCVVDGSLWVLLGSPSAFIDFGPNVTI